MGVPANKEARRFYYVAYQRLEDAQVLEKAIRLNAAVYLAGYAVECMLKALLIAETPANQVHLTLSSFRGASGHDLLGLRERLQQRAAKIPVNIDRELSFVSSWSTEMRYEPGTYAPNESARFLRSTERIMAWAEGRL